MEIEWILVCVAVASVGFLLWILRWEESQFENREEEEEKGSGYE